jgi:hypothetical protein
VPKLVVVLRFPSLQSISFGVRWCASAVNRPWRWCCRSLSAGEVVARQPFLNLPAEKESAFAALAAGDDATRAQSWIVDFGTLSSSETSVARITSARVMGR